jgi:hypothetical protein
LLRINGGEAGQRVIERYQVRRALLRQHGSLVKRHLHRTATALGVAMLSGVVDQDAPHQLSGDAEEVSAVLPPNPPLIHEQLSVV